MTTLRLKFDLDTEHERVMHVMSKKVVDFIHKIDEYLEMNKVLRFFRCEHIKREVHQVQEQILKLANDLNHLEIKRELVAVKER
jgi:hypothetical protein